MYLLFCPIFYVINILKMILQKIHMIDTSFLPKQVNKQANFSWMALVKSLTKIRTKSLPKSLWYFAIIYDSLWHPLYIHKTRCNAWFSHVYKEFWLETFLISFLPYASAPHKSFFPMLFQTARPCRLSVSKGL